MFISITYKLFAIKLLSIAIKTSMFKDFKKTAFSQDHTVSSMTVKQTRKKFLIYLFSRCFPPK